MNRVRLTFFVFHFLTVCVGRMEGQSIHMSWSALNAGGARTSSPQLILTASYGQAAVGNGTAGNTILGSGFLASPILVGPVTGISSQEMPGLPTEFVLEQNYPNPFNPSTTIRYQLPVRSHVTLKVYDILGREIATLADELQDAGSKSVVLNADRLASGTYFYRLQTGPINGQDAKRNVETKKLLLLR